MMTDRPRGRAEETTSPTITPATLALFSVSAGLAVANIYYIQPLLPGIARTFQATSAETGTIAVLGIAGYVIGLALLVPLGDVVNRRRLTVTLLSLVAIGQAVSALAPSLLFLGVATALVSVCAVVAPLLVSFAASLASDETRGKATGTVFSGILMGMLLARTFGGVVAEWLGGWRTVFAIAAVLAAIAAILLSRSVPSSSLGTSVSYPKLLLSVLRIMREEPMLRFRCALGFLGFAGFNAFWVTSAFLLSDDRYGFGEAQIGLVGLAGVAGAVAARFIGRLVDRGRENRVTLALFGVVILSWALMAIDSGHVLIALLLGVVLLDFAVQGLQTTNLAVSYRLQPAARSRITTAYMTTYFLGGAVGAAAATGLYAAIGWYGVTIFGALLGIAGVILAAVIIVRAAKTGGR